MAASTTQTALGLSSSHNSLDSLSGTEASSSDASPRRAYHKDTSRVSKETILSQSSKGWAGPGSGSGLGTPSPTSPLRLGKQPPSLSVDENSAPAISAKQHQPRRTSNSFRQLQRGLVSSSPFKSPEFSPSRFSNSTTARSVPLPRVSRLNQNNTARKDINIGLGIEDGPRSPEIPTSPLFSDDGDSPELKSAAYFAPKRVTPRKTQTFSQLQSHKLVSGSPFISSPSSPAESPGFTGSESSPEEQPAETQQATHNSALSKPRRMLGPRSLPNLNAQNTPQEAEAKQHSPALEEMGRPRSKTVTWGDDEVKEFVKEDFEDEDPSRRSSCTSSSSTDSPDLGQS